jgi:hypothetical protein
LRRFRLWGRELEISKSLVLQVGYLTCRWQRHSVKTFPLRILNDSWASHNPQGLQRRLKKKKKIIAHSFVCNKLQNFEIFSRVSEYLISEPHSDLRCTTAHVTSHHVSHLATNTSAYFLVAIDSDKCEIH